MNSSFHSQTAGLARRKINVRRSGRIALSGGEEAQTHGGLFGDTVLSGVGNSLFAAPFSRECL